MRPSPAAPWYRVAVTLSLLCAVACGGSGEVGPVSPPPAQVARVTVTGGTAPLVAPQTVQLSATASDASGATLAGRPISWASANSAVATVSSTGLVTAVSAGMSVVTATSEGQSGTFTVTVLDGAVVAAAGGTVNARGGRVRVDFPVGALAAPTTVTVAAVDTVPAAIIAGTTFEFGPSGATFAKPARINVQYDAAALPSGTDPSSLRLLLRTPTNWVLVDSGRVDLATRTVSGVTSHFSQYGVCAYPCPPIVARITLRTDSLVRTVRPGTSSTLRAEINGFFYGGSSVTLSARGLPNGVSVSHNFDGQLPFGSFEVKNFAFTFTAGASVPAGDYPIQLVLAGANVAPDSVALHLRIQPPGIGLTASPTTGVVIAGRTSTINLSLNRDGVTGPVTVSAVGLPAGVSAAVTPSPISGANATLTLTAGANATPGTTNSVVLRATATGAPTQDLAFPVSVVAGSDFTIAGTPPTVSLTPNGSGSTGVRVTRVGGFAGAISYSVSGLPPNVTGTITSTAAPDSVRLTLTASALAAVGTTNATVTATSGSLTRTASITVGVGAPGTSVVRLDVSSCQALGTTVLWAAMQSGSGAFATLTGSGGVYSTQFTAARGAAAIAWQRAGVTTVTVFHGTPSEISQFVLCDDEADGTKTVRVTTTGLTATQRAFVGLSGAQAELRPFETVTFGTVRDGPRTLVALRYDTLSRQYQRGILRRNDNPIANGLVTLDFTAADAFVPATAPLTVTGGGLDAQWGAAVNYHTNGLCVDEAVSGWGLFANPSTIVGIPSGLQAPGDLHELALRSYVGSPPAITQMRTTRHFFRTLTSHSISIGSAMPVPAVSSLPGPYKRLQAQFALPTDYTLGSFISGGTTSRVELIGTVGYFGGVDMALSMPDLSTVAGFSPTWAPGLASSGSTVTSGYTPRTCVDGAVWRYAARTGSY